jgi:hypothetical protein
MSAEAARPDAADAGRHLRRFAGEFAAAWGGRTLDSQAVVEQAAEAVPHTVGAGLTLVRTGRPPVSIATTHPLAEQVDAIENAVGEGPCIEALEDNDLIHAPDLANDTRWPQFAERAVAETPARSMFGVRVVLPGGDRGALNFYSDRPFAFTDFDLGVGAVYSALTSVVLEAEVQRSKAANLERALESSRHIGTAMGVLMSSRLLTAEQAFEELRAASQRTHRKVRDIAAEVTETGTLPD